jgi:hypothetical protein
LAPRFPLPGDEDRTTRALPNHCHVHVHCAVAATMAWAGPAGFTARLAQSNEVMGRFRLVTYPSFSIFSNRLFLKYFKNSLNIQNS